MTERAKLYGTTIDTFVYSRSIEQIRNEIGVHIQFREQFDMLQAKKYIVPTVENGRIVLKESYSDVSDRQTWSTNNAFSASVMQLTYNYAALAARLSRIDTSAYSHVVIMRSDLYVLHPLVDTRLLRHDRVYVYKGEGKGRWHSGYFILLTICPRALVGSLLQGMGPRMYRLSTAREIGTNHERTLLDAMNKMRLKFGYIDVNPFYLSYDEGDVTTWGALGRCPDTGARLKYPSLYVDAARTKNRRLRYIATGENVRVIPVT